MNVVSLAGGGCFAAIQARTLCDFLHRDRVDVWAGTSAGGAVALAMAAGKDPAEIISFFHAHAASIFPRPVNPLRRLVSPRYDDAELNRALRLFFSDLTCGELERPCLVTTHDLRFGVPQSIWTPGCRNSEVWKLARMTMSAHTYFEPFNGRADGGLFHNDPAMAVLAALIEFDLARPHEVELFCLGSGRNTVRREGAELMPRRLSAWLKIIINDTLQGSAVQENRRIARIMTAGQGGRYDEYEFPHSDMDFDDARVVDFVLSQWREPSRIAALRMNEFFAPHPAVASNHHDAKGREGAPVSPPAQEPSVAAATPTATVPAPTRGEALTKGSTP